MRRRRAAFKRRGYATFLGEEIHDGCGDLSAQTPSSACKLFYALLGAAAMPHHNVWQAFCQPELPQCCTDPLSFLRPAGGSASTAPTCTRSSSGTSATLRARTRRSRGLG